MIIEKQIQIGKKLLATGLLSAFYHSVEQVKDNKGIKYPAYKLGSEQFYIGPDDTKRMFGYIRQSGAVSRLEEKWEGGCNKMYKVAVPHRIVIFNDREERNFEPLIKKFLSIVFLKDVSLVSFNTNAYQLGKEESPIGDFNFDATTFYLAIDIQVKLWLTAKDCEEDNCKVYQNPICL